jgi:hypothetical protein
MQMHKLADKDARTQVALKERRSAFGDDTAKMQWRQKEEEVRDEQRQRQMGVRGRVLRLAEGRCTVLSVGSVSVSDSDLCMRVLLSCRFPSGGSWRSREHSEMLKLQSAWHQARKEAMPLLLPYPTPAPMLPRLQPRPRRSRLMLIIGEMSALLVVETHSSS